MMNRPEDPRLVATRSLALDAALSILEDHGIVAINHATVSKLTGISRSTLYRHWPVAEHLRIDAIKRAARSPQVVPKTDGSLRSNLLWLLSHLILALNETPWGRIAPHVISAAATNAEARAAMNAFLQERIASVSALFESAKADGEIPEDAPTASLAEMAISVVYFRRLMAGLHIDRAWLEDHIDRICQLAEANETS